MVLNTVLRGLKTIQVILLRLLLFPIMEKLPTDSRKQLELLPIDDVKRIINCIIL